MISFIKLKKVVMTEFTDIDDLLEYETIIVNSEHILSVYSIKLEVIENNELKFYTFSKVDFGADSNIVVKETTDEIYKLIKF